MNVEGKVSRLIVDSSKFENSIREQQTGDSPIAWRGVYMRYELLLTYGNQILDLSNLASLSIDVYDTTRTGSRLITKTVNAVDITATPSQEDWDNLAAQHAAIELSDTLTNISLDSQTSKNFWLAIYGVTTHSPGRKVTFGGGTLKIIEDGVGNDDSIPAEQAALAYTGPESDARFVQIHQDGAAARWNGVTWEYWFDAEGKWRAFIPKIVDGVPSFTWGPPID